MIKLYSDKIEFEILLTCILLQPKENCSFLIIVVLPKLKLIK